MKKITFVYDDMSESVGKEILSNLENQGIIFYSTGIIPIYAHADEDTIISLLSEAIYNSDMVVGISSSGNGIAIYANKIVSFKAASITSIDDIDTAIDIYSANVFDISAHNTNLITVCTSLIERWKISNEME